MIYFHISAGPKIRSLSFFLSLWASYTHTHTQPLRLSLTRAYTRCLSFTRAYTHCFSVSLFHPHTHTVSLVVKVGLRGLCSLSHTHLNRPFSFCLLQTHTQKHRLLRTRAHTESLTAFLSLSRAYTHCFSLQRDFNPDKGLQPSHHIELFNTHPILGHR